MNTDVGIEYTIGIYNYTNVLHTYIEYSWTV